MKNKIPSDLAHRKGQITVKGKAGTIVRVRQKKHHFPFGVAVNAGLFLPEPWKPFTQEQAQGYRNLLERRFNAVVHENALKWLENAPNGPQADYGPADAVLDWCEVRKIPVRGHCLVWEKKEFVQPWVQALDDASLRREVESHIREVMSRYRGRISEFDVNNEMIEGRFYQDKFGLDFCVDMFRWAHEEMPEARLFLNDYHILNGVLLEAYLKQIRTFIDKGAKIGGIGCQGHFFAAKKGAAHTYKPDEPPPVPFSHPEKDKINYALDRLAAFKLPILITEYDTNDDDPEKVAENLDVLFRTCFEHPSVAGIYQWGFWRPCHWQKDAALYDEDFNPTPAGRVFEELVFKEWWTDEETAVGPDGTATVEAFLGEHEVTIGGCLRNVSLSPRRNRISVS